MRNVVYKSKAIKFVISLFAILAILSIWPFGMWTSKVWVEGEHKLTATGEEISADPNVEYPMLTGVINYRNNVSQYFIPTNEHLQYIRVYVSDKTYDSEFRTLLKNSKGDILAEETTKIPEELPAFVDVLIDVDVPIPDDDPKNSIYTLIFCSKKSVYLGKEVWTNPDAVATSGYNDEYETGMNLIMDYCYKVPCSVSDDLLSIGIILILAGVLSKLTEVYFKKKDKDGLVTYESVMKCVLNPIIVLIVGAFLVMIILGKVSTHGVDNAVAVVGALLLGAILLYAVNHNRDGQKSIVTKDYIKSHIPDFIQAIAIAGAIQACCEYVSGLYNIHHYIAERKEMIWFAIIIIAMFEAKEIFNLYNLIYVIISAVAGVIYYHFNVTEEMTDDELFVLRATVYVAILLGFIIIRTIVALVSRKKMAKPRIIYAIPVTLMLAFGIIFKHDRMWTVTLAIAVVLLYINYALWKNRDRFIVNVIRGVVIQFLLCTVWVWMYRPFATFRTARFPFYFHTETMGATYLVIVASVGIVLTLVKVRKVCMVKADGNKDEIKGTFTLADIWKELAFSALAISYLFFTFSRTGYIAAFFVVFFGIIIMLFGKGKKICALAIKLILMLAVSVIVMIPVVFEIQRTVPCLVNDPYEYDIDNFTDSLKRGRKLNSEDYITVDRVINLFLYKILSMPEDSIDLYNQKTLDFTEYTGTVEQLYDAKFYDWYDADIKDEDWDKKPSEEQMNTYHDAMVEGGGRMQHVVTAYAGSVMGEADESVAYEATHKDYSNGRFSIYDVYLDALNMNGHPIGGPILEDGTECAHAHDVYLEVAYEHGIPTGIVFIILGVTTLVMGVVIYRKNRFVNPYLALVPVYVMGYAVAGIVEWLYHMSNPLYLTLWLMTVPLLFITEAGKLEEK
ncbi:MAG: O-antigen ligase family protein [Lachnospiraceae bacterium]|nr:O-antigen ligase family protein [Lachnospiraceae bacterium]